MLRSLRKHIWILALVIIPISGCQWDGNIYLDSTADDGSTDGENTDNISTDSNTDKTFTDTLPADSNHSDTSTLHKEDSESDTQPIGKDSEHWHDGDEQIWVDVYFINMFSPKKLCIYYVPESAYPITYNTPGHKLACYDNPKFKEGEPYQAILTKSNIGDLTEAVYITATVFRYENHDDYYSPPEPGVDWWGKTKHLVVAGEGKTSFNGDEIFTKYVEKD